MPRNVTKNSGRKATAKAAHIDRRPAIIATAISILTSLFVAYQVFF